MLAISSELDQRWTCWLGGGIASFQALANGIAEWPWLPGPFQRTGIGTYSALTKIPSPLSSRALAKTQVPTCWQRPRGRGIEHAHESEIGGPNSFRRNSYRDPSCHGIPSTDSLACQRVCTPTRRPKNGRAMRIVV